MIRPLVWHAGTFAVIPAGRGDPPAGMTPLGISVMAEDSLVLGELLPAQLLALDAEEGQPSYASCPSVAAISSRSIWAAWSQPSALEAAKTVPVIRPQITSHGITPGCASILDVAGASKRRICLGRAQHPARDRLEAGLDRGGDAVAPGPCDVLRGVVAPDLFDQQFPGDPSGRPPAVRQRPGCSSS